MRKENLFSFTHIYSLQPKMFSVAILSNQTVSPVGF